MEKYESDTRDIVSRFAAGRIGFVDCVQALDAALNRIVPTLSPEQLPRLQAAMLVNHELVLAALQQEASVLVA